QAGEAPRRGEGGKRRVRGASARRCQKRPLPASGHLPPLPRGKGLTGGLGPPSPGLRAVLDPALRGKGFISLPLRSGGSCRAATEGGASAPLPRLRGKGFRWSSLQEAGLGPGGGGLRESGVRRSGKLAVALLVFLARAARTRVVASDFRSFAMDRRGCRGIGSGFRLALPREACRLRLVVLHRACLCGG